MTFTRPRPLTRVPTATVVVPCYRYGRYLPQLIEHVLDQESVDVDIIIVDDASPDDSARTAQTLVDQNPAVSLIRHETNRGHIQTYNDGLAAATGEYVILLSADDLLPANAITRSIAVMEAHPSVGLVYGFSHSFSGQPPAAADAVRSWRLWRGLDWLELSARRGRCFIASPEVVMRRAALMEVGLYDPRLPHSADLDLWLRTALRWDIGRVNGPDQALYRVHESNMHLTTYAGWLTDLQARRDTFDLLFDEHAEGRPEVVRLRPATRRALAVESLRRALTAYRDGADATLVQDYVDFALETDPTVQTTGWWQLCRLGPLRSRTYPAVRLRRFVSRAGYHAHWRWRRRYGT